MLVLVLRVVRVGLVFVITSLLVQPLAIGAGLRLNADANAASRLFGGGVGGGSRALRTGLEHGRILDEPLGYISRIVGGAIVLALRIRGVGIVIRNRGWWVGLLWTLSCGRLRLLVGRLRRVLRTLHKRKGCRSGLLRARKAFNVFVTERIATSKPGLLVCIIEAL
jgi:hypothetical protein